MIKQNNPCDRATSASLLVFFCALSKNNENHTALSSSEYKPDPSIGSRIRLDLPKWLSVGRAFASAQ